MPFWCAYKGELKIETHKNYLSGLLLACLTLYKGEWLFLILYYIYRYI